MAPQRCRCRRRTTHPAYVCAVRECVRARARGCVTPTRAVPRPAGPAGREPRPLHALEPLAAAAADAAAAAAAAGNPSGVDPPGPRANRTPTLTPLAAPPRRRVSPDPARMRRASVDLSLVDSEHDPGRLGRPAGPFVRPAAGLVPTRERRASLAAIL